MNAHLSALGLTGVVFEMKKLHVLEGGVLPVMDPLLGDPGPGAVTVIVVVQKGPLGGILMGGGMLLRFPERELAEADNAPLPLPVGDDEADGEGTVIRVGDNMVIGAETELAGGEAGEDAVDETLRFSRGPRSVWAGRARVVVDVDIVVVAVIGVVAGVAGEVDIGRLTGTGTVAAGLGATGTARTGGLLPFPEDAAGEGEVATAKGAGGVRRGRSESWRRRRIISAETFHMGDKDNEGSAGERGGRFADDVDEVDCAAFDGAAK